MTVRCFSVKLWTDLRKQFNPYIKAHPNDVALYRSPPHHNSNFQYLFKMIREFLYTYHGQRLQFFISITGFGKVFTEPVCSWHSNIKCEHLEDEMFHSKNLLSCICVISDVCKFFHIWRIDLLVFAVRKNTVFQQKESFFSKFVTFC